MERVKGLNRLTSAKPRGSASADRFLESAVTAQIAVGSRAGFGGNRSPHPGRPLSTLAFSDGRPFEI